MVTRLLAFVLALMLTGCAMLKGASPPPRFMHQQHRETYAMTEADLEQLQFFVSTKVVAHDLDATGPEGVVLVEAGTPGVAVAAGPQWIRVRFQKEGQGVVFLADPNARRDSQYTLATDADGRKQGYQLVRQTKDRILRVGGRRYYIVEGAEAYLLVDAKTLQKVIAGRRKLEGEQLEEP
jgi:hypothetical protein